METEVIETSEQNEEIEEKSPEQVALEEKEAAIAERERRLEERDKEIQRRSSDLGRIAKQLEEAKANVKAVPEDDVEFDPADLDNFIKALKKVGLDPEQVSKAVALTQVVTTEQIDAVAEDFFTAHADVQPDEVIAEMVDSGVNVDELTPAQLKKALIKAHKAVIASKTDVDAIVQSRLEAELAKLKGKGEEIVSVKKGAGAGGAKTIDDIMNDPNLSPFDRMLAVQDQ